MNTAQLSRPIAITCGEPAGIGPDIILQAFHSQPSLFKDCIIFADKTLLQARAKQLNVHIAIENVDSIDKSDKAHETTLKLQHVPLIHEVHAGKLDRANSPYVIECINQAVDGCLKQHLHAMVTAPVHKGIINDAGITFSGHTEWIAHLCHNATPVMMLADQNLRVCLATTHLPLNKVANAITAQSLTHVLRIMQQELRTKFNIAKPSIGICGLNPHAGEDGHLGDEEIRIIKPVIEALRQEGFQLSDPLPADTIFIPQNRQKFDAILAMYHDQGLPVIKQNGFGEIVNITLGLPIIRTSVDHGTALDLAGTGQANADSLVAAIKLAKQLQPQPLKH